MTTASINRRANRKSVTDILLDVWGVLVLLFLFAPILVIIVYSFNNGRLLVAFDEPGFDAYAAVWSSPAILSSIWVSIRVGVLSAIVATVLGTLAGVAIARSPGRWVIVFSALLVGVTVTPEIVDAVSLLPWMVALGTDWGWFFMNDGIVRLTIGSSLFSTAVVTFLVRSRLVGIDRNLEDAASDLYSKPFTTFMRVTLPLAMPAVLAGFLLSFTLALDNTIIAAFVQVSGSTPWPVYVLSAVRSGLRPEIAAMSTLMLVLTLVVLALAALILRRSGDSATQIARTIAG